MVAAQFAAVLDLRELLLLDGLVECLGRSSAAMRARVKLSSLA
jgi:hypothetical protein